MKTSKNTVEFQIKKQIDAREIMPSRDLWTEIESKTQNPEVIQTKKVNWFLVAACLLLLVSLGTTLGINGDEKPLPVLAQKEVLKTIQNEKTEEKLVSVVKNNAEKRQVFSENRGMVSMEKNDKILPAERETAPAVLPLNEIKMQIPVLPAEKILAKTDSARVQKRKKYVDPSTLLSSVEHKDAIEQTKDGSNVAKIDLNAK